jgi:hypothetical protein|tara:strand:+ start:3272 stop:4390 length:1119 start_codon:yes stop_codon:yes gene_type:complete
MPSNLWILPEEMGDYAYTEYTVEAAQVASNLLWAMSGRKYTGETIVTERYTCTLRNHNMGPSSRNNSPVLFGGSVYNIPSGDYNEYSELMADGMSPESRVRLRGRPVTRIITIRNKDGLILDPSSYYLVDHSTIQIKAGTAWTPCNVEITYAYGVPVPVAGKMAARKLAIEFARLWSGDESCELPQRVTSVSRQGVSYTILDNQEFIQELRTGLYEIDLFLKVVNPDNARRKSKVFSVDTPRARKYVPKSIRLPASAGKDLAISATAQNASISWTSLGEGVDLSNFFPANGVYTPKVVLRNYGETTSATLDAEATTLDVAAETLDFTISYVKAQAALGMVDPGTWTLYASSTAGEVESLVELASGNLQIKMY